MTLDAESIGKNIRIIRKAAKKSQEAFAEEIDSTARTESNIENGAVVPMLQTIANISERFNCSVDSIIKKELQFMSYIYRLNETAVADEDGKKYTVYGIDAVTDNGYILESRSDIFFDRIKAEEFISLYDAVSGNLCSSEVVGEMNWAFDSDGDVTISGYNSNRFINVTAGDFDNDGKDTLIIYVANSKKTPSTRLHGLDYEAEKYEVGCYLKEYDFADNKLTMLNRLENDAGYYKMGYDLLNDSYIAYYQSGTSSTSAYVRADVINGSTDDSSSNQYTKLTVDMVVGDFNGDRIDDLAVLSYFGGAGAYASEYNSTPQIKIRYGTTGTYTGSFVDSKGDEKYTIRTLSDADSNGYRKLLSVCDGGLACGDINNDGYDDLFVAGTKLYTNYYKDNSDALLGSYLQDEDTFAYCVLMNNCNKDFVQSEVKTMTANDWTYGCSPNAVEAVAFNGENASDFIFINGSLYTYDSSTGGFNTVASQGYTTSGFQFDGALGGHEEFMRSVVVGNFDGNNAGREQILFVASCRDKDSVYSFKKGMIAGV